MVSGGGEVKELAGGGDEVKELTDGEVVEVR